MATNQNNLQSTVSQSRGCWFAVFRCFNSQPINRSTEPIEFENLVTAERRANDLLKKKQLVTEEEREHVMSGNYQQLLAEQERMDKERDQQLRRQEEALKMEEEAYYAAKRGASRREDLNTQDMTTATLSDHSSVEFTFPSENGPSDTQRLTAGQITTTGDMGPWTSATEEEPPKTRTLTKDEEDFDKFLESVKANQLSLTSKAPTPPLLPSLSDSEEEIDFGFWEKATTTTLPSDKPSTRQNKDVDLNLL